MSLNFVSEFDLQEAIIFSVDGVALNLLNDVNLISINIFEDIFKNGISGSIIFADTNNMIENLPIVGQEIFAFRAVTPGLEAEAIDFTENPFIIYKVERSEDVSVSANIVELLFVSPESITNYRRRISKSYTDTIDNIVDDVLTNELLINTNKNIEIEPTVGNRKIIAPNSNPFKFIEKLSREAISKNYGGSPHFLFFENKNGFHFKPLQTLYEQDIKQTYNLSDKRDDPSKQDLADEYKRMVQFSISANKDLLGNTSTGMLGSRLITHDIYNKNYESFDYGYFDNFNDFDRIESGSKPIYSESVVNNLNENLGDFHDSRIFVHPTSTTTDYLDAQYYDENGNPQFTSNKSHTWLQDRKNRMVEYNNGITATMTAHGLTSLTVGDIVDLSIPSLPTDDEDAYYSGKYLVTQLRHNFAVPEKTHLSHMVVRRDAISFSLPGTPKPYALSDAF